MRPPPSPLLLVVAALAALPAWAQAPDVAAPTPDDLASTPTPSTSAAPEHASPDLGTPDAAQDAIAERTTAASTPDIAPATPTGAAHAGATHADPTGAALAGAAPAATSPTSPDAARDADTAEVADADPATSRESATTRKPRARRSQRSATEQWMRDHVPDDLERAGPLGLEWWQWIAVPLLGLVAAGAGRVAGGISRASLQRLVRATPGGWDDALLARSRGPLYLAWGVGAACLLADLLFLRPPTDTLVTDGLRVGLILSVLWLALRAVDIAGDAATQNAVRKGNPGTVSVVPLLVRSSKIGLVAVGVVTVLSALGYPVASLLAGLGIGGLALALAAQKTAENVFGSVSIGVDQPFRVGDLVRIEDFLGVVERIGLRSTSVRTADRTLVTLPNGRLADMRVENFSVRDRMRLFCTIGLEYQTPAPQVRAVLAGLEARVRAHPAAWQDMVQVRFARIGPHALEIDVAAWFLVREPDALALVRQDLLLQFLEVVEESGARLAYPTQTVRLSRDG